MPWAASRAPSAAGSSTVTESRSMINSAGRRRMMASTSTWRNSVVVAASRAPLTLTVSTAVLACDPSKPQAGGGAADFLPAAEDLAEGLGRAVLAGDLVAVAVAAVGAAIFAVSIRGSLTAQFSGWAVTRR